MNEYQKEFKLLLEATMIHLEVYPGRSINNAYVTADSETKVFFTQKQPQHKQLLQKPSPNQIESKSIPQRASSTPITPIKSSPAKATEIPAKLNPPEPLPLPTDVQDQRLTLAPRPFALNTPPHFDDITKKLPRFTMKAQQQLQTITPPWIAQYPRVIIINAAPDCFIPFIQNVTSAINTRVVTAAFLPIETISQWIEIITYASTKIPKAIICFVDRKEQNPFAPIKTFISQESQHAPQPFIYAGNVFTTPLFEIIIDHELPESKLRKTILWNTLYSLLTPAKKLS